MEYRTWKKQNGAGESIRTSLLGYGCMRFPTTPEGAIDEPRAEALLNAARDAGVNYFDTAYVYGGSEAALGEALRRKGAVLRSCGNYPGLDASWYRTAVRTENENRQLLALLAETLPEVAQ